MLQESQYLNDLPNFNKQYVHKERNSKEIISRSKKIMDVNFYVKHVTASLTTFTEERDSSKLERKAWLVKGLNFSSPVASVAHASHSFAEISEIDETTEMDTSRGFNLSTATSYNWFNKISGIIVKFQISTNSHC